MKLSDQQTVEQFRDQCRRQIDRPLALRLKYGFCRTYKPVLDDAAWRAFDTMAEYRAWCERSLLENLERQRSNTLWRPEGPLMGWRAGR